MTTPRAWPNDARLARDRAAEEAQRGARLVQGERFDATGTLSRISQALDSFELILRFLEGVGAPTRPE